MKKTIIASVLGVAATLVAANSSQAQGFVFFSNYTGGGSTAPIQFGGQYVGSNFSADLLYSFDGINFSDLNFGQTYAFFGTTGGSPDTDGAGLFGPFSNQVSIPGYSAGNVYFIIQAYNGATYATSSIRGQSSVIQLNNLATAANQLSTGSLFAGDNSAVVAGIQSFTVTPVPEPSTLALAGLGGFGMLMALRRKKA